MRIKTYLNTTKKEVESKKHNIWIGVSLGNKYFTKDNIKAFIKWALQYTRDNVLIVIVDDIHAINYEIFDKKSKSGSLRKARKKGLEKFNEVKEIVKELNGKDKGRIHIARWNEVINSKYHAYREKVLFTEFSNNKSFHDYIIEIIKEGRKDREGELNANALERLAVYILKEIPLFINGVKYKIGENWKTYSLIVYPGLSKLDRLFIGLQDGTMFPEVASKLKITDKIAILEGYVS